MDGGRETRGKTIVMAPLARYTQDIIPTRWRCDSGKCNIDTIVCFMVLLTQFCKQNKLIEGADELR